VLTIPQAAALLDALPPLARTMVGLALLSGLRRGELFALRWRETSTSRTRA
jgi:integrase